jgi:hypothetical protein
MEMIAIRSFRHLRIVIEHPSNFQDSFLYEIPYVKVSSNITMKEGIYYGIKEILFKKTKNKKDCTSGLLKDRILDHSDRWQNISKIHLILDERKNYGDDNNNTIGRYDRQHQGYSKRIQNSSEGLRYGGAATGRITRR